MIIIYHNPKSKTNKKSIRLLETKFKDQHTIKHEGLELTEKKLKKILKLLNYKPVDIIKKNHIIWETLLKNLDFTDNELIKVILKYPKLLKDPIVINGNKVVIGKSYNSILNAI